MSEDSKGLNVKQVLRGFELLSWSLDRFFPQAMHGHVEKKIFLVMHLVKKWDVYLTS